MHIDRPIYVLSGPMDTRVFFVQIHTYTLQIRLTSVSQQ
jgi:hypothetical protein